MRKGRQVGPELRVCGHFSALSKVTNAGFCRSHSMQRFLSNPPSWRRNCPKIAGGMKPGEAAIICRYDASRVSILLDDPAFQELLSFYRSEVQAQYIDLHAQLAGLSADAAMLLQDQLEADMDRPIDERKLSPGALMEVTKLGADRTGHGPQSQSTNLNINVDFAAKLEAARRRVAERRALPLEDHI